MKQRVDKEMLRDHECRSGMNGWLSNAGRWTRWCSGMFHILMIVGVGFALWHPRLVAQPPDESPLFLALPKGDSVLIFLTRTLPRGHEFWVLRRAPGAQQWDTLTAEGVRAAENPVESREILGEEFPYIQEALDAKTELEVYRRLRGVEIVGDLLAMMSFRVAKALGRVFWDTAAGRGRQWQYRVVVVRWWDSTVVEEAAMTILVRDRLPKQPKAIELQQISDTYVRVRWDYPIWQGDLQDVVYGFNVYRRERGKSEVFQRQNRLPILRLNNGFFQFDDRSVVPGKTYEYVVTAVDLAGRESRPSAPATITVRDVTPPAVPQAPIAVAIEGGAKITWDIAADPDAAGYNLYRALSLQGKPQRLNKELIPLEQFTYIDTAKGIPLVRYYGISVVDRAGNESEISAMTLVIAHDRTPPPVPYHLHAAVADSGVLLRWQAEMVDDLAGYYVFRRLVGYQANAVKLTPDPIKSLEFFDPFDDGYFQPGAVVEYTLQAMDTLTNLSPFSDTLRLQIPDNRAPAPVRELEAWIDVEGSVVLHWQPSLSIDADTVVVQRYRLPEHQLQYQFAAFAGATMFHDTTVVPGQYRYAVWVRDRHGNASDTLTVTVEVPDMIPPAVPQGVRVRRTDAHQLVLEWNPVPDTDIAGYIVYAGRFPTAEFLPIARDISTTAFVIPPQYYGWYLKVSAVDRSGNESATSTMVLADDKATE